MSEKRKKKTSILPKILLGLIIVLLALVGGMFYYYNSSLKPVQSESEKVTVTISEGQGMAQILQNLADQGVIKDQKMAYYYARFEKINSVKAGTFEVDKSWDVGTILSYMSEDSNAVIDTVSVTLVEGDWAKDSAKKISEATGVSYDELIALWNNADWIRSKMGTYQFITEDMFQEGVRIYLEGYLYPETYTFYANTNAEEITCKILDQTEVIYEKYKDAIAASGYTTHQIFTLASIVQYEAGGCSDEDMKTVAGIIFNRLNINMPLQCSVTVCYAIDFDKETDDWTACEFNSTFESPYNTYLYNGLTPGPIENPGELAFDAVLNPIASDYYYWMADIYGGTGIHYGRTLDEHNANIAQYS